MWRANCTSRRVSSSIKTYKLEYKMKHCLLKSTQERNKLRGAPIAQLTTFRIPGIPGAKLCCRVTSDYLWNACGQTIWRQDNFVDRRSQGFDILRQMLARGSKQIPQCKRRDLGSKSSRRNLRHSWQRTENGRLRSIAWLFHFKIMT